MSPGNCVVQIVTSSFHPLAIQFIHRFPEKSVLNTEYHKDKHTLFSVHWQQGFHFPCGGKRTAQGQKILPRRQWVCSFWFSIHLLLHFLQCLQDFPSFSQLCMSSVLRKTAFLDVPPGGGWRLFCLWIWGQVLNLSHSPVKSHFKREVLQLP